ncbi:hypothetical protein FS749_009621 [Ceratobasidium sp. UAMH 11750]|nr:hypothetical protein FS749_009621 [Ceratobasidium sp. UAMH 11750]
MLSHSDAGTLLAAWLLGANDVITSIATSLRSCWTSTVLWRQKADETGLLDIQDRLEDLVSSVIQALAEPKALYQQFAPLAAASKDSTDRDARIRTSALGAIGWMLDTPPTVTLPQLIPALIESFFSNPLVGTVFCAQVSPLFSPAQATPNEENTPGSFGYGQRGVRLAAWGVVKTFVKYSQQQDTQPGEQPFKRSFLSSLGIAALRFAWTEPDASVRTSMWDPLLALITTSPEIWNTPPMAAHLGQNDDESSGSEEDVDNVTEEAPTVPPGQAAYIDFLSFLQLECLGSGVQSYPAIVIVLSTLPPTILPYDHDNLERFFNSFWAAYDSNALSVLPRDREPVLKSFLSAFLECVVLICKRLKQTVEPIASGASSTTLTLLESIIQARIGRVMTELVHGGLAESLPIGVSGALLGESIKKLEQIDSDSVDRAWSSAWKSALLDTQVQVPQGLNAAKLLASMLSPTAGSALNE